MEKRKVVEAIARLYNISTADRLVGDMNSVRFVIRSVGGGVVLGRKLFIFDHRPEVVEAAKTGDSFLVNRIFCREARVVVMEKIDGEKKFYYVNVFPVPEGQKATCLFTETAYVKKWNADWYVKEDTSIWSWVSESRSRTSHHEEMRLVSLTDEDHAVVVHNNGYANIGHSNNDIKIISHSVIDTNMEQIYTDLDP